MGVLLLEDSPADSRLLVESLRDQTTSGNLVIQTVRRLADALRELKRFHFSCVLVDLGLPDGEGVRNVARIREADPNVAIVVLTGLADERAAEEAFELGAQDYLIKGQRLGDELLAFVRLAIAKRHSQVGEATTPADTDAAAAGSVLSYQPWVDLSRGSFGGVHVGLSGEISNLSTALGAFRGWHGPGFEDVTMAMSIPANWLPRLASQLAARMGQADVKPAKVALRLEASEIGIEPSMVDNLRTLRATGTQIWLEGWRPATALLERLVELPLDGIVIDARAVDAITRDAQEPALRFVRATLALGGALGLDVIADGVALAEQHSRLFMVGCTQMQGARFCQPEPAEELPARWRKGAWGLER